MIEILLEAERALSVGQLEHAERLYRQASEADPRNSIAVVGLARVALERADDLGAYLLARKALGIDPENEAARRLATRLLEIMRTRGDELPAGVGSVPPPAHRSAAPQSPGSPPPPSHRSAPPQSPGSRPSPPHRSAAPQSSGSPPPEHISAAPQSHGSSPPAPMSSVPPVGPGDTPAAAAPGPPSAAQRKRRGFIRRLLGR